MSAVICFAFAFLVVIPVGDLLLPLLLFFQSTTKRPVADQNLSHWSLFSDEATPNILTPAHNPFRNNTLAFLQQKVNIRV